MEGGASEFRLQSQHRVALAKTLKLRELKCDIAVRVLETKKCSLRAADIRKEEATEVLEGAFSGPDGAWSAPSASALLLAPGPILHCDVDPGD
eukprot:2647482-Rhodomonas_salina.1